jgi:hypothetical protein
VALLAPPSHWHPFGGQADLSSGGSMASQLPHSGQRAILLDRLALAQSSGARVSAVSRAARYWRLCSRWEIPAR